MGWWRLCNPISDGATHHGGFKEIIVPRFHSKKKLILIAELWFQDSERTIAVLVMSLINLDSFSNASLVFPCLLATVWAIVDYPCAKIKKRETTNNKSQMKDFWHVYKRLFFLLSSLSKNRRAEDLLSKWKSAWLFLSSKHTNSWYSSFISMFIYLMFRFRTFIYISANECSFCFRYDASFSLSGWNEIQQKGSCLLAWYILRKILQVHCSAVPKWNSILWCVSKAARDRS